jgi:hypothetical protein
MANALTEHQREGSYSCPSCHALGLPRQSIDILALIKKAGLSRFCPGWINFPRIYIPVNTVQEHFAVLALFGVQMGNSCDVSVIFSQLQQTIFPPYL